ncbi:MAG: M20/M25/M40 family metallo-hydrolase [Acidobacteria bacterium]|nr:M20/M25/M40 family metallo-hydrolase [Acidobacteriota bacterium]
MCKLRILYCAVALFLLPLSVPVQAEEKVDLDMVTRIRYEGFRNSQVMKLATALTDGIGARLTGSSNMKRAEEWARNQLASFGLADCHLEAWGPFGRGWENEYINLRIVGPDVTPLIAYAKAWTPGTSGVVEGKPIRVKIEETKDFEKYRGKLAGKIALFGPDQEARTIQEAPFERLSEKQLDAIGDYQVPSEKPPSSYKEFLKRQRFQRELNKFWAEEKVLAVIDHGYGAYGGGTVFVQSGGSFKIGETATVPAISLDLEQWNRIARLLEANRDVSVELNVQNKFRDDDPMQYNVVAEIPGTDKKNEFVMLGAHLDSWHSGTGATDNGAGSVVSIEAVRILKALDIRPRRTIRLVLWSGEEQGLLGSQNYVQQHFGFRPSMNEPEMKGMPTLLRREAGPVTLKPEQEKVSVYFNLDNGTGKIRGVYLQENAAVWPIFDAWIQPFRDLGMTTLTMRNTGGTDHLSFDAVGIPAFQFIQDPIEYMSRTHHSNMDVYDRLQSDDLRQAAVIMADFVYNAAMREQMLPRKTIEKPLPMPAEERNDR